MAKLAWNFVYDSSDDFTAKVLSFNISYGRTQYLDQYPGGRLTLTINNAGDYATGLIYGKIITVTSDNGVAAQFANAYWIEQITYDDYPGSTGLNTATVVAADWIARAGRVYANALSLASADCSTQFKYFDAGSGGPLPADMVVALTSSSSIAAATTYSGTVTNYLNLLNTTERGYVQLRGSQLYLVGRPTIGNYTPIATTMGRTASTTQIAYQDFNRIQAGQQYINTATITPSVAAAQTAVNSSSLTLYGPAYYSSATVDNDTTQALGNAQWVVSSFGSPSTLRFELSFIDVAQDATALTSYMTQCWGTFNRAINVSYTPPGGASTTVACVIEGAQFQGTPAATTITLSLSPFAYYQFFTLNSATLGILDTSRLGW